MKIKIKFCFLVVILGIVACNKSYEEPNISLLDYEIEDGFNLKLVASEPLIKAPVAIDFDQEGRIWVVEMPGFMRTIDGDGEEDSTGTIKILEDLDHDGIMDHSKIFLENLVLPRALALVYGGVLYAEPPNLWFVEINNDRPGKRTLVDSLYAPVGNPEHQANGLKLNIDNWIYSAKSNARYQLRKGRWVKETSGLRGQWGITHDNYGRLYYNNNSTLLLADFLIPNRLIRNPYYVPSVGVNQRIAKRQRVYPVQTSYVNRGYVKNVLDKDSLLIKVTAACAPVVYRGGQYPSDYNQNVFVCLPEANIIKRNVLLFQGDSTVSSAVVTGKEFLASYDRGFRPVNMNNGPDGSLYVVDMHIGMLQHYAFLSPYLKKVSKQKKFDTIIDLGRILKIFSQKNRVRNYPNFKELTPEKLVDLLGDKNGWIRDRVQQHIIFRNLGETIPYLKKQLLGKKLPLPKLHALYALQGLNALDFDTLIKAARNSAPQVTASVLVMLETYATLENSIEVQQLFDDLLAKNNSTIDLYLSTTVGIWASISQELFFPFINTLLERYPEQKLFQEALLSGLSGMEEPLLAVLKNSDRGNEDILEALRVVVQRKKENNPNRIFGLSERRADARTTGAKLFREICAACHASDGEGINGLAPPLMNSGYVTKPLEKLALIILHGIEGPVHVNQKLYELDNAMPGLLHNAKLTNQDIADIISYVTSAFSETPGELDVEQINALRNKLPKSGSGYTEQELLQDVK